MMRLVILVILGLIGGYFLGSIIFRLMAGFGVNVSGMPLIFMFFPYLTGIILAILLPVIDKKNRQN
ncbi:DUF5957 family protein [Lentibacillus sp.]|uniref:DUF5957 family protein n=1 Tax=Lentibacillus sp. TaxID=1925746 RepID=UPI002B4B768C|nr:DUF5957 family protein [Lentibacillus sp.]HLS07900.1 DUF5957 family protein [Lentibacillus sp.]